MRLRDLFDVIDAEMLDSWIRLRQQENLHLDFKRLSSPDFSAKEDRKTLAIAASGFANSDGGIIVWGVDSRKDDRGVDAASALLPIEDAAKVHSRLESLTGDATTPLVDGVLHRLVALAGNAGVLATLIPSSERGPHMAGLGEGRYYKRSGDSFYRMEHFDVQDMFGRRARPELSLQVTPIFGGAARSGGIRNTYIQPTVSIVNGGRGIAKFPLLRLRVSLPATLAAFGLDGNGRLGLPLRLRASPEFPYAVFAGAADDVIHAGSSLPVTKLEINVTDVDEKLEDVSIEYELACEGAAAHTGTLVLKGAELLAAAKGEMERCFPRGP